jgi:hypothetical protein
MWVVWIELFESDNQAQHPTITSQQQVYQKQLFQKVQKEV